MSKDSTYELSITNFEVGQEADEGEKNLAKRFSLHCLLTSEDSLAMDVIESLPCGVDKVQAAGARVALQVQVEREHLDLNIGAGDEALVSSPYRTKCDRFIAEERAFVADLRP